MADPVILAQEEQDPRLPIVVGRHLVVEPEYLGPSTEQRGTVGKTGKPGMEDRPDEPLVELSAHLKPGNERSHLGSLSQRGQEQQQLHPGRAPNTPREFVMSVLHDISAPTAIRRGRPMCRSFPLPEWGAFAQPQSALDLFVCVAGPTGSWTRMQDEWRPLPILDTAH